MTRRFWIYAAVACCACSRPPRSGESLLPASVSGAWMRRSLRTLPPQTNIERAFEATYEGTGRLTVDLYETRISAVAFEMMQRWKPAADTVFFQKDRYFVVVKWERADRQALTSFVRGLEKDAGL